MILQLSRNYSCCYKTPVISYIDTDIFNVKYASSCMECKFCNDSCCSYGVDVDFSCLSHIREHQIELERYVGISSDIWFDIEQYCDEYPEGGFVRARVVDGACVFLNRKGRGCLLHAYSLEIGTDYHLLKPFVSCLFPLTFDRGVLYPALEIEDGTLICLGPGETLYRALRQELLYYFGSNFVNELDDIEANYVTSKTF